MMLEVVEYPAKVLTRPARRIAARDKLDLHAFYEQMRVAMLEYDGIGLAAPQVGQSIRFIVAHDVDGGGTRAFVNPNIIEMTSERTVGFEGCLSFPGVRGEVERAKGIRLRYQDLDLNEHEEEFTGFYARVLQHEIDHLNGVLLSDRAINGLEPVPEDEELEGEDGEEYPVVGEHDNGADEGGS